MENLETISENAIVFQSVAEQVIAKLQRDYLPLLVTGVNDKEGCKVVNEARKHVRKLRTSLEAERKKLKAKSLEYGRNLDGEAKRLSKPLVEMEEHLMTQEKIVTDEFARVKAAEQKAIEDKYKQRIVDLIKAGAVFDGKIYVWNETADCSQEISDIEIWNMGDAEFDFILRDIKAWKIQEDEKKAEADRLAKIKADEQAKIDEKKRKDQAEITKNQEEAQAKIDADKKVLADREVKIKAAEKKIADDKAETERLKQVEADKKKAKEEAEKKVEQDRLDKIEANKRTELLKPDKEKLYDFIREFMNIETPILKSEQSKELASEIESDVLNFVAILTAKVEQL